MLKKSRVKINSINNNDNKTENEIDIGNENNLKKNKFINSKSLKIIDHSLTPIYLSKIKPYISYINDSIKQKIENIKINKKKIISLKNQNNNNNKNFNYSSLTKKNVLVPNFDKMMPRNLKKYQKNYISNEVYFPNYNAIFSGVLNNRPIDYEYRKKSSNLKKIICIYNPTLEYKLFPELNLEK